MKSSLSEVICVCCRRDIETWKSAAPLITKYVIAKKYIVYVPDGEVAEFRACTPQLFRVVSESSLNLPTLEQIAVQLPEELRARAGWLLQQFIKIESLRRGPRGQVSLIWDADTIPIRSIRFHQGDKLFLRSSSEFHAPYFVTLERLLGLPKTAKTSFIAQCLPCFPEIVEHFCMEIESRHKMNWISAVLFSLDTSSSSGFSEYESLGTFMMRFYPNRIQVLDEFSGPWDRNGYQRFSSPSDVLQSPLLRWLTPLDYVAFESWQSPSIKSSSSMAVKLLLKKLIPASALRRIERKFKNHATNDGDPCFLINFLRWFFSQQCHKKIVQVGANDGEMCDPLREHLRESGSYDAVLIEPLPYYSDKLRMLYGERNDVSIQMSACGAKNATLTFYYLPPEVADAMDGDGPSNGWAHGQGSFDRETIVKWIYENAFRGEAYRQQIPEFIKAITSMEIPVVTLAELVDFEAESDTSLLLIDAQGFEIAVLDGVDWRRPPHFVICEDDVGLTKQLVGYLSARGYVCLGGGTDKVFCLRRLKALVLDGMQGPTSRSKNR
jgi:FkbM family methyltransferase